MLKRIFKKIGLSLLFAGVLSVGLSINSANAITPQEQSKLLKAVQEVVKENDDDYTYNAKDFWGKVSEKLKSCSTCFKGNTAYANFSQILKEKGISLQNKGDYWTIIFKPYKEARTSNESLTLEDYISEIAEKFGCKKQSDVRRRESLWSLIEEEALYTIVEDYLKGLKGNPLPKKGAWKKIIDKCKENPIFKGKSENKLDIDKIRKHFCKTNFKERGELIESGKRMREVLNGFSKYISGNPQNPLSLRAYIKNVNSGKISLSGERIGNGGDSETHNDQGYDDSMRGINEKEYLSAEEIVKGAKELLGLGVQE